MPSVAVGVGAMTGTSVTDQRDQLAMAATASARIITVIRRLSTRDRSFIDFPPPLRCD
jgi:hypothetical protein